MTTCSTLALCSAWPLKGMYMDTPSAHSALIVYIKPAGSLRVLSKLCSDISPRGKRPELF
jgi:hypothetical protein